MVHTPLIAMAKTEIQKARMFACRAVSQMDEIAEFITSAFPCVSDYKSLRQVKRSATL